MELPLIRRGGVSGRIYSDHLVNLHRLREAFDHNLVLGLARDFVFDQRSGHMADRDFIRVGGRLQSQRQIGGAPQNGVV